MKIRRADTSTFKNVGQDQLQVLTVVSRKVFSTLLLGIQMRLRKISYNSLLIGLDPVGNPVKFTRLVVLIIFSVSNGNLIKLLNGMNKLDPMVEVSKLTGQALSPVTYQMRHL